MGIKNEPFQFFFATGNFRLTYDSDTGAISGQEQLVPFTVYFDCVLALNHIFTMKSLILAQDERWLQA